MLFSPYASDHLPLTRFLQKTMFDCEINNWGLKLSDLNIKFKFIQGVKTPLVMLSLD